VTEILPFPAPRPSSGRRWGKAGVPLSADGAEALRQALVAAMADGPALAVAAAGLRAFAELDIRDLPPKPIEPFRCNRCHDLGWVSDWANWPVGWAWQRVQPVPRKPCPDCTGGAS
jgi:hypothetical protein